MRESEIQKACLQYLQLMENLGKCYFVRTSSGAVKTDTGRYFRTGKKGSPDIICCYKGQFIGLEIKSEKGRQSPEQKEAEAIINNSGGKYCLIRSLDELIKIIK